MEMLWLWRRSLFAIIVAVGIAARPHRILLDTDVDSDDFFAMLYLLKLNTSQFDLQAVTINTNEWSDGGHSVNHIYDILYMMGRDDVAVGVGGEGGILEDGTIQPNVGGYIPIIDQGSGTAGPCRYRQTIPVGAGGRLYKDTNFGYRKSFLPQGSRRYSPLKQPTAQQVLIEKISNGPISLLVIGAHTNIAIFLMTNPHLKNNIEHIYIMGGGVRSKNPTGGNHGNLYTCFKSNPYAEFNFFGDPFAAYQVIHSGIPVTLVPLDATNTIPITQNFFEEFERNQHTYEAQYVFKTLKMVRDTWFDDKFYENCFMWDSFMSGVSTSIMRNLHKRNGENEFAEMEYMNITVITSNKPYGISDDGSNNLFDGRSVPKFNLTKNGVHSGHVQTGIRDPFCLQTNGIGRCKDGYTEKVSGPDSVRVLLATRAKQNRDKNSSLDREFFVSFLNVLNLPQNKGRFNFSSQFPYYKEVVYKPDFEGKKLGKTVVFDMDMSAGDFLALFYLLKVPVDTINLKAILVTPTGWTNAATIDVIYDLLHMMGRDDIIVGLGDSFGLNQSDPNNPSVGGCKYLKAIPHGSGGLLDSDTLFGLARDLPRSPRRYTAENSVEFGAPRNTDHPQLRQPLALEVWKSIVKSTDVGSKITILTNGPLTTLAKIILADANASSIIQDVFIVGGHIGYHRHDKGNVINVPLNIYAEMNMFLDPLAAKVVFDSMLDVTLIPLSMQRKVCLFPHFIKKLDFENKTPEARFSQRLLKRMYQLQQRNHRYQHMDTFLGEILGAVILTTDRQALNPTFQAKPLKVDATGDTSKDGQITVDPEQRKSIKILHKFDHVSYYDVFADRLADDKQSAVIGNFNEQKRIWSTPQSRTGNKS
ncbi:putative inosine/uridine-preferring nucleoside hydrolase domain, ribonucleoside hydrolase [Helianthus debilis subsp. tardiflorus]